MARPAEQPGRRPCGKRAFSLIELVVVVAVVTIMAAIAMPRMAQSTARYRTETACRRVAADLEVARARAGATSAAQSVVFSRAANRFTYTLTGMSDPDRPALEYTVDLGEQPYCCDYLEASFGGPPRITFDGYGRPEATGTVEVGCGAWRKSLTLEVSGEVSGL